MHLPPIADPQQYVGLYVYDFKTHVAIGYTAHEVRILRESARFRDGTAYEIYRVSEQGGFELRGALDEGLVRREAICFLRHDAAEARADFDQLRAAADRRPVPAAVEMTLTKVYEFDPPHVTALTYPAASSLAVSGWLTGIGFDGGDRVIGGTDVQATLAGVAGLTIDSCRLRALLDYEDRSAEEVLASVENAMQR
jgi:hypothetical protein